MALRGSGWHCVALRSIAWHYAALCGIAWHSMALCGIELMWHVLLRLRCFVFFLGVHVTPPAVARAVFGMFASGER